MEAVLATQVSWALVKFLVIIMKKILATFSNHFGECTNNKVELLGLLHGLWFARSFCFLNIDIKIDSMLVIK